MKILWELFFTFAKIGMFTFGGGYAMISLIEHECVGKKQWIIPDEMMNITVIAESTPGPIMVNSATYIGNTLAGFWGALAATTGVVLPSFIIILLIVALFQKKHKKVQMVLKGIKPCLMGIIIATGFYLLGSIIFPRNEASGFDYKALIILLLLILISIVYYQKKKKAISPILLIIASAVMGCALF
ncbi:chromate transporter [bacterium 1XD21-13]|nr:chromate transporter [bacterium 1XD21-13]